jgi:hypothetical protein
VVVTNRERSGHVTLFGDTLMARKLMSRKRSRKPRSEGEPDVSRDGSVDSDSPIKKKVRWEGSTGDADSDQGEKDLVSEKVLCLIQFERVLLIDVCLDLPRDVLPTVGAPRSGDAR